MTVTVDQPVTVEDKLFYRSWDLKQKNGKIRRITAPSPDLNKLQHDVLYYLYGMGIGEGPHAEGFVRSSRDPKTGEIVKQKNIVTNAEKHCGKEWVLNVDIKDFFPSCDEKKVIWVCKQEGMTDDQIAMIIKHCMHEGNLPTGACTSPFLSNIVAKHLLDNRMAGLAETRKATYSRYVDDLTWSSNEPLGSMIPVIKNIVKDAGFQLNPKKIVLMSSKKPQMVTGLVVNPIHGVSASDVKPRVLRHRRRRFRAILHNALFDAKNGKLPKVNYGKAFGYISFMHMIDPELAQKWKASLTLTQDFENLLRRCTDAENPRHN